MVQDTTRDVQPTTTITSSLRTIPTDTVKESSTLWSLHSSLEARSARGISITELLVQGTTENIISQADWTRFKMFRGSLKVQDIVFYQAHNFVEYSDW